jgi:hypothetical protein
LRGSRYAASTGDPIRAAAFVQCKSNGCVFAELIYLSLQQCMSALPPGVKE